MANSAPYIRVHRSQLLPALVAIKDAVDRKATIPILGNVLLRPQGAQLLLRATNLAIEIEATCDLVEVGQPVALTLVGDDLQRIVNSLPEAAEIEFHPGAAEGQVRVQAGKSRFLLLSLPERDFPTMAEKVDGEGFTIEMAPLVDAISKVLYAIRDDPTRFYLSGVFIHPFEDGAKLAVVGCDGHNLAVARIRSEVAAQFEPIIIPLKSALTINGIWKDTKARAHVTVTSSLIRIKCEDTTLISKLVDGTYPDYARIIPAKNNTKAVAAVKSLLTAVNRVCLVVNDMEKDTLRLSLTNGVADLQLATMQGEEANDTVAIEYDGEDLEIGFNGKYIEKMLGSIRTQDVEIAIADSMSPATFRPTIDSDEIYIVMPRRL